MGRPPFSSKLTDTPTRVLDAAERAFALAGLAGARLGDIAEVAGIRRPSLLHYFASKEQLYAAVVERGFARLGDALAEAMDQPGEFLERLQRVQDVYVAFLDDQPELARLMLRQLIDGDAPGRRIIEQQIVPLLDRVEDWIRTHSDDRLGVDAPIRAVLLNYCTTVIVRAAAGELREPLWGPPTSDWPLAAWLFAAARAGEEQR